MSRTLTAQDRSSLIRLAKDLPVGSSERKAILAGLSKTSGKSPVQIVLSTPKTPWTTGEVWADYQNRFSPDMAAEAVGNSDLTAPGWDRMSENEALAMVEEMQDAYHKQVDKVLADLKAGVASGLISRITTHGGGGEWIAA